MDEGWEDYVYSGTPDEFDALMEALDRADNLYAHLRRNVYQAVSHPALDMPTKVRRMSGLTWRMHALEMAHRQTRVAFESIVKSKHRSLIELPDKLASWKARAAAQRKVENDPRAQAMNEIRAEWQRMQTREIPSMTDAAFARKMIQSYGVIENEGSIKNACTRWRKELKSSS